MPLDLRAGERCFVDANILVYELIDAPPFTPHVHAFTTRVARKELIAFTTSVVLSEALHRIMLAEVQAQFQPTIKPLAYVQRNPEIIAQLSIYPIAVDRLAHIGIDLLSVDVNCWRAAGQIAGAHRLLTNDACVVAVMALHNLRNLVTNDDDFDHVSGITTWKPR